MSMEYVFEIEDWRGRLVRLTQRTFTIHKEKRSITSEYLEEAQQTIRDPDIVQLSSTGATLLYRFGLGKGIYSRLYLMVAVHYRRRGGEQEGIVATYFFTNDLAFNEPVIEYRAQWMNGQRHLLSREADNGRQA